MAAATPITRLRTFVLSVLALASLLAMLAVPALAAVPQTLSYQGVLTDNGGGLLPDGPHDFTFRLYTAASGGSALWTENQNAVPVTRGGFSVVLGAGTPAVPLALPFDVPYWLGLSVDGGAELSPRTVLTASPYSLNARNVADGAVTANSIAGAQVVKSLNGLKDDVSLVSGANVTITPGAGTLTISSASGGLGGTGTANQLAKFTAPSTLGNSSLFDSGTFVGVNRSNPITTAEFFGVRAPVTNGWGGMYVSTDGSLTKPFYGFHTPLATAWTELDGTDANKWKLWNGSGYQMTVQTDGRVGLGTMAPTTNLEVAGGTKLGSDAPAIRMKKFTGVMAASQGGFVTVPLGVPSAKVLSVSVQARPLGGPDIWLPPAYTLTLNNQFTWAISGTDLYITCVSGNSANLLNQPFVALLTYEE